MFDYPAAYARTRSMKADLLKPATWASLVQSPDFQTALQVLFTTCYARVLGSVQVSAGVAPSLRHIEHALRMSTIDAATRILRFLSGAGAGVLVVLVQHYELLNLKKTVRRLCQTERRESRLSIDNFDLGPHALVRGMNWDEVQSMQALARLLESTYYRFAFQRGMQAFGEGRDLLVFESLLERAYNREVEERISELEHADRVMAARLYGTALDRAFLSALIQLRCTHGMSPEQMSALFDLRGCRRFTEQVFWAVSGGDSEEAIMEKLREQRPWAHIAAGTLRATVQNIEADLLHQCRTEFAKGSPLSLGSMLAYYLEKELEVLELIRILQAKRFHVKLNPEHHVLAAA